MAPRDLAAALMPDPNNIGMSEADYGGWGSTGDKLRGGMVAQLLAEPFRKGAGLLGAMRDYSANEFPGTFGVTQQSTDYDPRREAAGWAAGTAMNMVGVPAMTGGVPADALGSAAKGIRAYHGSPHDFDRFDMSRIGTGEGAQAYGHGLYFAEAEDVARTYRDNLSGFNWNFNADGKPIPSGISRLLNDTQMQRPGLRPSDVIDLAEQELRAHERQSLRAGDMKWYEGVTNDLSDLHHLRRAPPKPSGRMYEVNINARPEEFLDWDKPLGQQANPAITRKAFPYELSGVSSDDTAGWFYQKLRDAKGHHEASDTLAKQGIPGIRYLDQGSRGAGQGSSNYVVFDDKLIDILRKYSMGIGAAPAGAMMMGEDAPVR
jgi:hypothetical protein